VSPCGGRLFNRASSTPTSSSSHNLVLDGTTSLRKTIERRELYGELVRGLGDVRRRRGARAVVGESARQLATIADRECAVGVGHEACGGQHAAGQGLNRSSERRGRHAEQALDTPAGPREIDGPARSVSSPSHRRLCA
jgi:hypothetical protein